MATGDTYLESDGKSVTVTLNKGDVVKDAVTYAEGWLGIASADVASGYDVALQIDMREHQIVLPSGLGGVTGDTIYIDTAHASLISSHVPADAAYSTSAGSGKVALCKLTSDQDGTTNVATAILLAGLWAS